VSHPAIIAYKNEDGTFDLHYSRNGAERYQLKEILEGYFEGQYEKLGSNMPGLLPTEVAEFAADQEGVEVREHDLIEQQPFAEAVEPHELPHSVPDISAELLFVVRDWQVDVFSIVPVTPSLLPLLANSFDVKLYDCDQLGINPQEATDNEQPASYSLSEYDFFNLTVYEEMPLLLYHPFAQYHLDILRGISEQNQAQNRGKTESISTAIYHDGCIIEYRATQSDRQIPWSALFVEVWPGEDERPSYPWEYNHDDPSPRALSNELRLELSMLLIEELRQHIGALGSVRSTKLVDFREYRTRELKRFFTMLESQYGDAIADEFSPFHLLAMLPPDEALEFLD